MPRKMTENMPQGTDLPFGIAASESGARIDLRSRSRIGRIDRGVNAKRIRAFLAALKESAGNDRQ